ncbi:glycoside hydrolase family 17 protein [Cucurbitaria berberidis CBS 394.84]|uniref:glucan endo-1,3-beta-D-glucosidase n=1 Tax=Cucurbitaria berberidis CBS 394.84 TaxID=1168544 RepID=A0A9P4G712_9PLEO|nr:glycoside hydrolase family 17 protein [Cucurbitaria berberidis CBS 394.84]KAF1840210.1 glycoside hydrolase family 17 protein [Cucurbitaria berberidis CBS 394.84]
MAYQPPPQNHWDQANFASSPIDGSNRDVPPPPPAHRHPVGLHSDSQNQQQYPDPNNYSDLSTPGATPGSDNLSQHSGGGISGRPMGVPEQTPNATPFHDQYAYDTPTRSMYSQRSYGSNTPSASGAAPPIPYLDTPYNRYSSSAQNLAPQMGHINPNEVADDDDWGMDPNAPQNKRRSFVPFRHGTSRDGSRKSSPGSSINGGVVGAGAAGAAAGTAYAATRDGNGNYNPVATANGSGELLPEKSRWPKEDDDLGKRKKHMWIVVAILGVVLIGAILGGVLGTMLGKTGGNEKKTSGTSADDVTSDNKNDLGKDSPEIKALLNNGDLHKVFPGMDYTPLNAQYPDCMHVGPSQNNITRDMAVMSQLTNAVRLYGTDCNQTQMLIHAIDRLEIKDTMKIWLGVWLDKNDTTTERQIAQTWKVLDDYGCDYFKGIIIGNEVLYRKDMNATELLGHITDFRKNITDHKCKLPVAMADLGDNWTAEMATKVDYVMSNVHPFFAGVDVKTAASWTWNFWQDHDVLLTKDNSKIKQVIAEVGWPTGGGKNCGQSPSCTSSTPGSVAGLDELNQFMEDWICPSLKNQTNYFWFSAFDEPWKVRYNEKDKGKEWEDKWGLMDIDRKLKPGLKIPDCGGQALPSFD